MWRLGDAAGRVCATSEIHNCYFGLVPFSPPTLPPPRRFKPPYACLQTVQSLESFTETTRHRFRSFGAEFSNNNQSIQGSEGYELSKSTSDCRFLFRKQIHFTITRNLA